MPNKIANVKTSATDRQSAPERCRQSPGRWLLHRDRRRPGAPVWSRPAAHSRGSSQYLSDRHRTTSALRNKLPILLGTDVSRLLAQNSTVMAFDCVRGQGPEYSLHLLKQLHWLPVEWRIKFKIATLTFKDLATGQPPYLAQQLCAKLCIHSYQSFTLFHIQTSSSSTYQPPAWLALFSCICSHPLELIASQHSFL